MGRHPGWPGTHRPIRILDPHVKYAAKNSAQTSSVYTSVFQDHDFYIKLPSAADSFRFGESYPSPHTYLARGLKFILAPNDYYAQLRKAFLALGYPNSTDTSKYPISDEEAEKMQINEALIQRETPKQRIDRIIELIKHLQKQFPPKTPMQSYSLIQAALYRVERHIPNVSPLDTGILLNTFSVKGHREQIIRKLDDQNYCIIGAGGRIDIWKNQDLPLLASDYYLSNLRAYLDEAGYPPVGNPALNGKNMAEELAKEPHRGKRFAKIIDIIKQAPKPSNELEAYLMINGILERVESYRPTDDRMEIIGLWGTGEYQEVERLKPGIHNMHEYSNPLVLRSIGQYTFVFPDGTFEIVIRDKNAPGYSKLGDPVYCYLNGVVYDESRESDHDYRLKLSGPAVKRYARFARSDDPNSDDSTIVQFFYELRHYNFHNVEPHRFGYFKSNKSSYCVPQTQEELDLLCELIDNAQRMSGLLKLMLIGDVKRQWRRPDHGRIDVYWLEENNPPQ